MNNPPEYGPLAAVTPGTPGGIMVILAVYTLRDVSVAAAPHGLPEALALGAAVGLHLWKRNAVLSIIGGTAIYVALVNLVFGG